MNNIQDRWRMFVGYLAESTAYFNQRTFHVYIPELLPTLTGDISHETATQLVKVTNVLTNTQEEINVSTATTITAEYFGVMVSRTVPTMYKNQQVLVFNFANDDRFFWLPLERDDHLRTFEQIRLSALDQGVTNKSTAVGTNIEAKHSAITTENTYYVEVDTKYHKHIVLSTSASDGETYRYLIKIDANSHSVEIRDIPTNKKIPSNSITLESEPMPGVRGRIKLENAAGTSLTLEDKNMKIHVPKDLEISVGGNLMTHVQGSTTSSFNGAVNSTMKNRWIHAGFGSTTLNLFKHFGMAVIGQCTITGLLDIVTNTPGAMINNQGTRAVTTLTLDTVNSMTAIRNQTTRTVNTVTMDIVNSATALRNQAIRTVNTAGVDTLTASATMITAATGNWTIASMADTYVIDLPEHGHSGYKAKVHQIQ